MGLRRVVGPLLAVTLAAGVVAEPAAHAGGFTLFQHGGRATGQVGAFTARAADATALSYNPAALTRLGRFEAALGIDFAAPRDDYDSATGSSAAQHAILYVPAVYAAWHPESSDFAFGIGIDSPYWYLADWRPVFFPGRFLTRRVELTLFEVHPSVAWALDERWSVGGGFRWVQGTMNDGDVANATLPSSTGPRSFEVERVADGSVDGWGADVAVHFVEEFWGWGAVLRSGVEIDGEGDVDYRVRGGLPDDAQLRDAFTARFAGVETGLQFELPPQLRGGVWYSPYPELRLELDVAYNLWSQLDGSSLRLAPDPNAPQVVRRRDWDDTLSLRAAAEGDLSDDWGLFGGVAFEPSPVDDATIEPGFPRGDAMVYAAGFSYRTPKVTFDVGYSFHDHDARGVRGQEAEHPGRPGSYSAHEQVWAASARWRFE